MSTPDTADAAPIPIPTPPRYWAFVSYSHHDKALARKLQRQLETYRVPRRLVGRETAQGPVPARLTPLFRDRDELNAGADLKASVQEALAASRWLIVVCTPDAARSPWVNREIVEFKRLHGEGRVLALIARGEPFASNTPGREASECFPAALRFALTPEGLAEGEPLEPIAADQRAEGDGPRRAALKLLAGMIGVGFDDLVQRDTQRRLRWLAGIATASAVGVVVFALLAVLAVQARNEAQRQRTQAEGLIEFMLGDLRKKLEPVGRLEVLDSVGEKALAYYGAQEAGRLDATALGHRSRAMHLIGEIRDLRGNAAEAQAAFEQAAATTRALLAQAPQDPQRLFDHSQSVFWVGYAAWKHADGRTAETQFQEYLALATRLVKMEPTNADWQAEVAYAQLNLGTVQLGTERPAEALVSLQASGDLLAKLAPGRPELLFELAHNHGWRAKAYELLGDYENALQEQLYKRELFQRMRDGDKNKAALRGVLSSYDQTSMSRLALGRVAEAQVDAEESLRIATKLVEQDSANMFWRSGECFAHLRLVEVERASDRQAQARNELALAARCVEAFRAGDAWDGRDTMLMRARLLAYTAALAPKGNHAALEAEIGEFIEQSSKKLRDGTPDRAKLAIDVANAAIALGDLQAPLDSRAARAAWRQAADQLLPLAGINDAALLVALANAQLRLGDVAAAQAIVNRIQRSTYRHPAFLDLVQQLPAARGGSSQPSAK